MGSLAKRCKSGFGIKRKSNGMAVGCCTGCPVCTRARAKVWEVTFHGITACCYDVFVKSKLVDVATFLEVPLIMFPIAPGHGLTAFGLTPVNNYAGPGCTNLSAGPLDLGVGITLLATGFSLSANVGVGGAGGNGFAFSVSGVTPGPGTTFTVSSGLTCDGSVMGSGGTATVRAICGVPILGLAGNPLGSSPLISFPQGGGSKVVNVKMCKQDEEWFVGHANLFGTRNGTPVLNDPNDFLTFSATSGVGDGNFTITAPANSSGAIRQVRVFVNGNASITVTQAA